MGLGAIGAPAKPKRDPSAPVGMFFSVLRRVAGSELAERYGVRKPLEKLLYNVVRQGTSLGGRAASRFKAVSKLLPGQRLKREATPQAAFDLTPTEEQQMLHDMLRRFADDVLRPLAPASEQEGWDPGDLLAQTHELGLTYLAVPEALGGAASARSPLTTALAAEDLARGDMGLALAALSPLGFANAVAEMGTLEQQGRYLPAFVGDTPVAAALASLEPVADFDPGRLATRASLADGAYRLSGEKVLVPLGAEAEVLLVTADLEGRGPRAFLLETDRPGVTREPDRAMGLGNAKLARVVLEDVEVPAGALLGGDEYDHQRLIDLGRIGACALAVGTGQAVLEYVVPYCNERIAFGEPISHRQAVAFMIADLATELEGMRLLTWRAASRAEQGLSFHREAELAWLQCSRYAMKIGTDGVQLLGGHGYVCEHPVERWYRQLRASAVIDGALVV